MTERNPIAADSSPDSDFSNQWPFELSDYLNFDDNQWLQIDPTTESNFVYHANELEGDHSHIEGTSSSTSKSISIND